MVKDTIKCFMCSVKGIEKTFNSYGELQDHLYKDHDMHRDPAMELFSKPKVQAPAGSTPPP